jgi:hypothetical protein
MTALAISPNCKDKGSKDKCRIWIAPAGGGIWRAKDALSNNPKWEYLTGDFDINAVGSISLDPNDPSGDTLFVGTGEANACGSGCEAGVGIYKSTDGGDHWIGPLGPNQFGGRSVGSIVVKPGDPKIVYASSTRGLRGHSSVCCGGAVTLIPGAPQWGLYKSTDGGFSWTFIHNGSADKNTCSVAGDAANTSGCSPRGVRRVALDPVDPEVVYAGSYARGIWRSPDGGATWSQIFNPIANGPATGFTERPEFAVTKLAGGDTRMYVSIGSSGNPPASFHRSDSVRSGAPVFTQLSSSNVADAGWGAFNLCTGQCWYDNFVTVPDGHPDMVYVGGSYSYGEQTANHRGVVLSMDAGASWYDMTEDNTDLVHPNTIHPDQHALVTNPGNPLQFFEVSDGGLVRSSGELGDKSAACDTRGLSATQLARCQQMLSKVPTKIESMNKGLTTLQFQSLSVNPFDVDNLQGGTQDNGTWETKGKVKKWTNTMIGDGGQSGFDVGDKKLRFHTFFGQQVDVNLSSGAVGDWNWVADPFFINPEPAAFYIPIVSDPKVTKTIYAGLGHVWRTKTYGIGSLTVDELRENCNEWTGTFGVICGDWVRLGDPGPAGFLTSTAYGADKIPAANNWVAAVERAPSDTNTLWAATSGGRVFVSKNSDAEPASSVTFTRIDTAAQPNRFVSGIYVDPGNSNHAWVSFSGFNASTPATPGHVFEVTYNPGTLSATWTSLDGTGAGAFPDIPATDVVQDGETGDVYVSTDFGVSRLAAGTATWGPAAPGIPNVEVAGLTLVQNKKYPILYAATHGLGAWRLNLAD